MPELQIQPFSDEHLEGAASLLEERHDRQRAIEPRPARRTSTIARRSRRSGLRRSARARWRSATASSSATCSALIAPTRPGAPTCGWNTQATPCASRSWCGICTGRRRRVGRTRPQRALRARACDRPRARRRMVPPLLRRTARRGHPGDARIELSAPPASRSGAQSGRPRSRRHARPRAARDTRIARPCFSQIAPTEITDEDREQFLDDIDRPEVGLFLAEIDGTVVGELLLVPRRAVAMHVGSPGRTGAASSPSRRRCRKRAARARASP